MLPFIEKVSEELKEVLFIRGKEESSYYTCNALLINDLLIDTGISTSYLNKILENYQIKRVILTHWHEDHISGSNLLHGCRFLCHLNDKPPIEDINLMYKLYGFEQNPPKKMVSYLKEYNLEDTIISHTLKHADSINVSDEINLRVIHTPGHTSGHCCFYEKDSKFAFLSDINMPGAGPWYGGIDCNLLDYEESLKKLRKLDIRIAVFSHYGLITDANEINDILIDALTIIQGRDEVLLSHLSEKKAFTAKELSNKQFMVKNIEVYEEALPLSEEIMIEKHFEKFLKQELIERKDDGYILS